MESVLLHSAVVSYAIASVVAIFGAYRDGQRVSTAGDHVSAVGVVLHGAAIITRWIGIGHAPFISLFELVSTSAWLTVLYLVYCRYRARAHKAVSAVVLPVSFLSLVAGMQFSRDASELTLALASYWLIAHVFFALLGYGCYILGSGASAVLLWKWSKQDAGAGNPEASALDQAGLTPPADASPSPLQNLDTFAYRMTSLGFVYHAIMIVTGALWANQAWGRFWAWDPIETWSLLTWLVFALYIHLRLFWGWRGRRAAIFTLFGTATVIACFWLVPNLTQSIHDYGAF